MRYIRTKSKYHNKKLETEDGVFDSRKEYLFWKKLKAMEFCGEISDLQRQVKFVVIPAQYEVFDIETASNKNRNKIKRKLVERECSYVADFVYIDNITQEKVVIDVKGFETEVFKIKRKLMYLIYKIKVQTV